MNLLKNKTILASVAILVGSSIFFYSMISPKDHINHFSGIDSALAAKFEHLSQNGNSACSTDFKESIGTMSEDSRIQGSCCSPMVIHRYAEQVEGLKKYKNIPDVPPNPYDIDAQLAKKLLSHYDMELTLEQQREYDYAMQNSDEKGPCCCKCWHWYVYGGLGKHLIKNYNFTGEQVAEVWDLSDGCGGNSDHHHM